MDAAIVDESSTLRDRGSWLRRVGVAGFVCFLVKGLAWLVVPAVIALAR